MKNKSNTIMLCLLLSGLVSLVPAGPVAFCSVITSNPDLPPDTGVYVSPEQVTLDYTGTDLQIFATNVIFDPIAETAVRTRIGADELETFEAIFTADFSINLGGSLSSGAGVLAGPASTITQDKWDVTTGLFNAEIVEMSLSGDVDGLILLLRESPTLASSGSTTITDLGGGLYDIDSFFDVFTELSVDGGASWIPADSAIRMNLVPEPATMAILGLGGLLVLRKRRT